MTNIQRIEVAERTTLSWQNIPHVSFLYEADVTDLWHYYRQKKKAMEDNGIRLTWNTLFVKIIANAMKTIPLRLITNTGDEPFSLIGTNTIHIDMPTIFPDGKMLPVTIRRPDEKSLEELAMELQDISHKASLTDTETVLTNNNGENTLTRKDIAEGTFTLSNLGSLCKIPFQPLLIDIIAPQTIAIALGSLQEKPGICTNEEGTKHIEIRKVMPITIVFDHRAYDFGELVPFLTALDERCKRKSCP